MRLLLDECIPRPLLRDLTTHDAHHVVDMGWSSKRNGELLKLMLAGRFEILLTVDQNLPFQQNLRASGIGEDEPEVTVPEDGPLVTTVEVTPRSSAA